MVRVHHLLAVLFALVVASALFVQPAFALVLHGEANVDDDMTAQVSTEYVTRLAGNGALDTMSAIVEEGRFATGGTVVLASLEGYWDALTAAGIAGLEDAPVVMTGKNSLSAQASAQLKKLKPTKIIVCGGTYWIPDKVLKQAASAAGISTSAVTRLSGGNATQTAIKIAEQGKGRWSKTAIVATVGTFQDALAAAPVSYAKRMPIFLAQFDFAKQRGSITQETIKAMKAVGITKCYIAGGTYWLPKSVTDDLKKAGITVIKQLAGKTAVETSAAIAREATSKLGMNNDYLSFADVRAHYDALAGAAFCGKHESVMLLVENWQSSCMDGYAKSAVSPTSTAYIFGGEGSVEEYVEWQVWWYISDARDLAASIPYIENARDYGPNRKLIGNVELLCIFVNHGTNSKGESSYWSESDKQEIFDGLWKDAGIIEDKAASYGVELSFTSSYFEFTVPPEYSVAWDDNPTPWFDYIMENYFNNSDHSVPDVQNYYEKSYNKDYMPLLFFFNKDGRCYCYQSELTPKYEGFVNEFAVYYPSTMSSDRSIAHELFHLFGAQDYYYPATVKEAAQKYFPDSVMLLGDGEIDDLTAYLIGWTDTPSETAKAFMYDVRYVTQDDADNADK